MNEDVVYIDIGGVPPEQVDEWMKQSIQALEESRKSGGQTEMMDILPKSSLDELTSKEMTAKDLLSYLSTIDPDTKIMTYHSLKEWWTYDYVPIVDEIPLDQKSLSLLGDTLYIGINDCADAD